MNFSKFDIRMFNEARMEAESSEFKRFHTGAVIVYKKHIIGRGKNDDKSHPMQKEYNRKYRVFNSVGGNYINDSIHAEIAAISSIPYTVGIDIDWSKVKVYVYRISRGTKLGYGLAKPCPACMNALKDLGIKNIYYTDSDGYSYLQLDV